MVLAVLAALIFGITRGEKRAARILRAIGQRIPGVGGDRLEQVTLQAAASLRALGTNRSVLISELTARGAHADHHPAQAADRAAEDEAEHQDGSGPASQPPTGGDSRADSRDARR